MKFLILLLCLGCTKMDESYLIKKGTHKSSNKIVCLNEINVSFTFTEDHKYLHLKETTQINKLIGLSTLKIHENSARFGYRQEGNKFKVYAYYYNEGVNNTFEIYEAEVNELLILKIKTGSTYYFEVNGNVFITSGVKCKYMCYPYFGGTVKAPKDFIYYF
jgi:hypothetical protein